jgi:hypothetical protein
MRHHFREIREVREDKGESSLPYYPTSSFTWPQEVVAKTEVSQLPDEAIADDRTEARKTALKTVINRIVTYYNLSVMNRSNDHTCIAKYSDALMTEANRNFKYGIPLGDIYPMVKMDYDEGKLEAGTRDLIIEFIDMVNEDHLPAHRILDVRDLRKALVMFDGARKRY